MSAQPDLDPTRFVLDLLVGRGFAQHYTDLTHTQAEAAVEKVLHEPGTWTIHLFPQRVIPVLGRG